MQIFLIPVKGMLIRDPRTKEIMPETGWLVELNGFWQRRVRDKSVIVSDKKKESVVMERKKIKEDKND